MTHQQKHVKVKGEASPYDGKLVYWAKRLKEHPLLHTEKGKLLKEQNGRCAWCDLYFVDRDEDLLEIDHIIPKALGGTNELSNKRIYHRHCHDAKTARDLSDIRERKAAGIVNT
jgi:RNA-directed DNA polymerase